MDLILLTLILIILVLDLKSNVVPNHNFTQKLWAEHRSLNYKSKPDSHFKAQNTSRWRELAKNEVE